MVKKLTGDISRSLIELKECYIESLHEKLGHSISKYQNNGKSLRSKLKKALQAKTKADINGYLKRAIHNVHTLVLQIL